MLRILRYLKYAIVPTIIILLLLAAEVYTDLSLPVYTAKIVNIGVEQGGMESYVPQVISVYEMECIENLLYSANYKSIEDNYVLANREGANLTSDQHDIVDNLLGKDYEIKSNTLYVIKNKDLVNNENLKQSFKRPLVLLKYAQNPENEDLIKGEVTKNLDYSTRQVLMTTKILDFIHSETYSDLAPVMASFEKEKFANYSESILTQSAIAETLSEYEKLGVNIEYLQTTYLKEVGTKMSILAVISAICAILIMFFSAIISSKIGKELREKTFKKVLTFSIKDFRKHSTASLVTRTTADISHIQSLINSMFRIIIFAPIVAIGGIWMILYLFGSKALATNTYSSFREVIYSQLDTKNVFTFVNKIVMEYWGVINTIILIVIAVMIVIAIVLYFLSLPRFKRLQHYQDKVGKIAREIISGNLVIRAFNTHEREEKKFDNANKQLFKSNVFSNNTASLLYPLLLIIMDVATLIIVWNGGHSVDLGEIQVGDLMAFLQYATQIVISFVLISSLSITLPRASVSAKRVDEVLNMKPEIMDKSKAELKSFSEDVKGRVEFRNVSFKYSDAESNVISNINLQILPGKTTAIVGSTGSGKSTIVNLIPRFYDVTEGELLVDGVNVKDVKQSELHKKIAYVPQKGILFSGTIESNIKYGNKDLSDEDMLKVASIAQAEDFIKEKKYGYKDEISQRGNNISGGQKQRIAIARALAVDSEIVIFDDAFSTLDFATEKKLRDELKKETEGKTVIMVAQRITSILDADQIIVVNDGKIVGKGRHRQLLLFCETYRQIAMSQLSMEELRKSLMTPYTNNEISEQSQADNKVNFVIDGDKNNNSNDGNINDDVNNVNANDSVNVVDHKDKEKEIEKVDDKDRIKENVNKTNENTEKQEQIIHKEKQEQKIQEAKEILMKRKLEQEQREKMQKEKLQKEKLEQERLQQERLKQEKLQQERLQQERLQQEKLKQEKLQQEKLQQEKMQNEMKIQEQKRKEAEQIDRQQAERLNVMQQRMKQQNLINRERQQQGGTQSNQINNNQNGQPHDRKGGES